MDNKFIIIIGIISIILFHHFYFKTEIGANIKFQTLTNMYIALCTFVTVYSIYLSNKISYANVINTELDSLNPLFQNITQDISSFFIANTNMNYYYDELFNGKINQDESIRHIILEQIITNNILITIDSIINYIDSYKIAHGTNFQLKMMETKLKKLLEKLLKSPIFVENWNNFKNIFALEWTKIFIKINFNK